jgi:hypothetical protein
VRLLQRSAIVAPLTVGALVFAINPAFAQASGTGEVTFPGLPPCALTFDYTGGPPPNTVEVQSVTIDPSCASNGQASGTLTFDGTAASFSGTLSTDIPLGTCVYQGSFQGTYADPVVTFSNVEIPLMSGPVGCPDPANFDLTLDFGS